MSLLSFIHVSVRRGAVVVLSAGLAGCNVGYVAEGDAPASFHAGAVDPRLAVTQLLGRPLAPIVRNIRAAHGKLYRFAEVEAMLRAELRPLDIVLTRSRPAMTRVFIPSHFTHAMVWLGTERDLKAAGLWSNPVIRPHQQAIREGLSILESSRDDVHLSPFSEMVDLDEVVILRNRAGASAAKYAALLSKLGITFDYAFDYSDTSRLTCAEMVAEAYPEFRIPVRYSAGRLAIIPDDLGRRAVEGSRYLSFRLYIRADGKGGFETGTRDDFVAALSQPGLN